MTVLRRLLLIIADVFGRPVSVEERYEMKRRARETKKKKEPLERSEGDTPRQ